MQRILKRTTSMLCSLALTLSLLPISAAAEDLVTITGHDKLIQGLDSDITIDLGDTAVNGERTILCMKVAWNCLPAAASSVASMLLMGQRGSAYLLQS